MATKMQGVSGSYDKSVPDSGDGGGLGGKQDSKKFTKGITEPTDKFKKPTDKGSGVKTISEQRSNP